MAAGTFVRDGVTFRIANDMYKGRWTPESGEIRITYRVPWDDRFKARKSLLGWTEFKPAPPLQYGYLKRTLPHATLEGEFALYCSECDVDPEVPRNTDSDLVPTFDSALLAAVYTSPKPRFTYKEDAAILVGGVPDESLLQRYVSRSTRSKNKVATAKGGAWKWADTDRVIASGTPISLPNFQFVYTWKQVPMVNLPWASILTCLNRSNAALFDGRFATERIVCADVGFEEIDIHDGINIVAGVNISYFMEFHAYGVNTMPDPERGWRHFPVIAADGSLNKPYPVADFASLFRPVVAP